MTHIDNISHILRYGITHAKSPNKNQFYKPIGDESIITTRYTHYLDDGSSLGDYIPFYFGVRMPMLYVIQKGYNNVPATNPEIIVYCILSIKSVLASCLDFKFTDGHAIDSYSSFYQSADVDQITSLIDFSAVGAKYWKDDNDLDKKRRKEAEFLISQDIPVSTIVGYITYNESSKKKLENLGIDSSKIVVRPQDYF